MKDWLTTGEIARALSVATRTVVNWIDTGRLKCVRIPSNSPDPRSKGDRRVYRDDFESFCREYEFRPNAKTNRKRPLVLTLGCEIADPEGLDIIAASSTFEAGMAVEKRRPDVIVIDWASIGRLEAHQIVSGIACVEGFQPLLIGVINSENLANEVLAAGFHQPAISPLRGHSILKIVGDIHECTY